MGETPNGTPPPPTAPPAPPASTRERVRELREESPYRPAADIARELGITRERVRQHLVALGLETVRRFVPEGREPAPETHNTPTAPNAPAPEE